MDFIPKSDWTRFCDRFSKVLEGLRAEIRIASLDLGNQTEAKSLPILGLSYDAKDDIFSIALEGITHIVNAPQQMHAEISPAGVSAIAITDADGAKHLIRFTQPLALPHAEEMQTRTSQAS